MLHWEVSIRLWDDWGVGGWRDDDVCRVGRNSRLSLQRLILTSPLKGVIYGTNSSQPVNLKGDILAAYSLSLCFTFKLKFGWCFVCKENVVFPKDVTYWSNIITTCRVYYCLVFCFVFCGIGWRVSSYLSVIYSYILTRKQPGLCNDCFNNACSSITPSYCHSTS